VHGQRVPGGGPTTVAAMEQLSIEANGLESPPSPMARPTGRSPCASRVPDTAYTWRHLLPDLAAAGYRAVAPFMRGYAPTAIPADGRYQTGALARDANELHQALGGSADAVLIGHDWGAAATYGAIAHQPERWRKAVTASVPPLGSVPSPSSPTASCIGAGTCSSSSLRWPKSPLPVDDWVFLDRLWADWSPGYDAAVDVAHVKDAIATPERIEAALATTAPSSTRAATIPSWRAEQAATTAMPSGRSSTSTALTTAASHSRRSAIPRAPAASSELSVIERAGHFVTLENPSRSTPASCRSSRTDA